MICGYQGYGGEDMSGLHTRDLLYEIVMVEPDIVDLSERVELSNSKNKP